MSTWAHFVGGTALETGIYRINWRMLLLSIQMGVSQKRGPPFGCFQKKELEASHLKGSDSYVILRNVQIPLSPNSNSPGTGHRAGCELLGIPVSACPTNPLALGPRFCSSHVLWGPTWNMSFALGGFYDGRTSRWSTAWILAISRVASVASTKGSRLF